MRLVTNMGMSQTVDSEPAILRSSLPASVLVSEAQNPELKSTAHPPTPRGVLVRAGQVGGPLWRYTGHRPARPWGTCL